MTFESLLTITLYPSKKCLFDDDKLVSFVKFYPKLVANESNFTILYN